MIELIGGICGLSGLFFLFTSFGDGPNWIRIAVAVILMIVGGNLAGTINSGLSGDCSTDWDGRSNRTVCE